MHDHHLFPERLCTIQAALFFVVLSLSFMYGKSHEPGRVLFSNIFKDPHRAQGEARDIISFHAYSLPLLVTCSYSATSRDVCALW